MLDETLDAAQALGEREQVAALEGAARRLEAAAQHRPHDSAVAGLHLPPGERVLRVALETGVVDALDRRVLLEELRDRERVGAVPLHAQRERLDAAQREKAVERTRHPADRVLQEAE